LISLVKRPIAVEVQKFLPDDRSVAGAARTGRVAETSESANQVGREKIEELGANIGFLPVKGKEEQFFRLGLAFHGRWPGAGEEREKYEKFKFGSNVWAVAIQNESLLSDSIDMTIEQEVFHNSVQAVKVEASAVLDISPQSANWKVGSRLKPHRALAKDKRPPIVWRGGGSDAEI
jgi:hypothetical protein